MKNIDEKFLCLSKEVEDFSQKLETSKYFTEIFEIYKGFQILYSALNYNPMFMFLGINPGAGYYNSTGEIVKKFLPEKKLEYSFEEFKYALARETRFFFELANIPKGKLENAVKTNFYFIATSREKPDLNKIIETLVPLEFEKKSKEWNLRLIKLIKPKILICEGCSAFKKFTEDKKVHSENFKNTMYAKWDNIDVIGYKRHWSNVRDKDELANLLKKVIQKNHT